MRPYIICHMVTSINGKVAGDFLCTPQGIAAAEKYYLLHREYNADAFACGRITMEGSFTNGYKPDLSAFADNKVAREDFAAAEHSDFYAVAFDTKGKLGWTDSHIHDDDPGYDNAHIIEVLCENTVSDAYLAYLKSIGVSYIFGGKEKLDLHTVLEKLYTLFGIKKLLLEGGGVINGSFVKEDLIDEISLVAAPVTEHSENSVELFEGVDRGAVQSFKLNDINMFGNSIARLNYSK